MYTTLPALSVYHTLPVPNAARAAHTASTTSTSELRLRCLASPVDACTSLTPGTAVGSWSSSSSSLLLFSGKNLGMLLHQHLSALPHCSRISLLGNLPHLQERLPIYSTPFHPLVLGPGTITCAE
jgi:hypothetical protein